MSSHPPPPRVPSGRAPSDRGPSLPARDPADLLAFHRSLPTKRLAAGLLVRDTLGRVLLLEPTYKPDWEIPGGVVELGESPLACARREAHEELGLTIEPGRLLVVDHQPANDVRTEAVKFVFDGGRMTADELARVAVPADEIRSWACVEPDDVAAHAAPPLARRLRHALEAGDRSLYLEDGEPV